MFVGLSFVKQDRPPSVTGTIIEWRAGESIAVGRPGYSRPFTMALRASTVYEGDASTLEIGARVTVWYRNVSERRLVAQRVRVLDR